MTQHAKARDAGEADACAMCGRAARIDDHCHVCGYIRGRLCRACNGREARECSPEWTEYRARCAVSDEIYLRPYNRVALDSAILLGIECARLLRSVTDDERRGLFAERAKLASATCVGVAS